MAVPKGTAARKQLRQKLTAIAHHGDISQAELDAVASTIRKPRQKTAPKPAARTAVAATPTAKAPKKMGRPRKDQNGEKEELVALLKEGVTFRRACDQVGIALRTMWDWYDQDDTFRAALSRAREAGYKARIDEALERAQAAADKDAAYCARVVADIALKTLELHQRSQQLQVNVTGGASGPVTITWAPGGLAAGGETQAPQLVIEGKAEAGG
jgi:hypothetical protein